MTTHATARLSKTQPTRQTVRQQRRAGLRKIAKLGAAGLGSTLSQQALMIRQLVAFFGNEQTFVRLTGLSLRSVANYKSGRRIVRGSNERRIIELNRLKDSLGTIMKPQAVPAWLQRPNPLLQDFKPIEVIERGNTDQIWRLIYLGQAGSPS